MLLNQDNHDSSPDESTTTIPTIDRLPPEGYKKELAHLKSIASDLRFHHDEMVSKEKRLMYSMESELVRTFNTLIDDTKSPSSSKLTQELIMSLPEVEKVVVIDQDTYPNTPYPTISIILKPKLLHKSFRIENTNTSIPFIVPSYTIVYQPKNTIKDLPTFTSNVSIDSFQHYYKYDFSIYWTDWRALSILMNTDNALRTSFSTPQRRLCNRISPYAHEINEQNISDQQSTETYGITNHICFGANNNEQYELLSRGELFLHLKSLIATLYHPDDSSNQGYSNWGQMISPLLSLQKEEELKKRCKELNLHSQFIPRYDISRRDVYMIPRHTITIELSKTKQKIIEQECMELGKEVAEECTVSCSENLVDISPQNVLQYIHLTVPDPQDPMPLELVDIEVRKTMLITNDKIKHKAFFTLEQITARDIKAVHIGDKTLTFNQFKELIL